MPQDSSSTRTERYETIIIGGGQVGLAAARELQGRDVDYLVLDPGVLLPASQVNPADHRELAASLDAYVAHFDLALRLGVTVRSLRRAGAHFEILASDLRYEATNVIVAMSPQQNARQLGCDTAPQTGLYFLGGESVRIDAARIAERIAAGL